MPSRHALDSSLGAMFIGALITLGLYGITVLQTYFYYLYYPRDGLELKFLVALLWVLDTLHVIFISHAMYWYLITGFGDAENLQMGVWSLFSSILLNICMSFIVQCFFAMRIYFLCPPRCKRWILSIVGFFVLAHFCFGIDTVAQFFRKREFIKLRDIKWDAAMPFAFTAILSDIVIATSLCILLNKSRTGFKSTNNLITYLILLAINRCVLTSAMAIIELLVYLVLPKSAYFLAIDFPIGKLYTNSLLASLNTRASLRGKGIEETTETEISTSFRMASTPRDHGMVVTVASTGNPTDDRLRSSGQEPEAGFGSSTVGQNSNK